MIRATLPSLKKFVSRRAADTKPTVGDGALDILKIGREIVRQERNCDWRDNWLAVMVHNWRQGRRRFVHWCFAGLYRKGARGGVGFADRLFGRDYLYWPRFFGTRYFVDQDNGCCYFGLRPNWNNPRVYGRV